MVKMKRIVWILLLIIAVYGCTPQAKVVAINTQPVVVQEESSDAEIVMEDTKEEETPKEEVEEVVPTTEPVPKEESIVEEPTVEKPTVKEFRVRSFRFDYDPNTITVKKGDRVRIIIDNTDFNHGMFLPEFGVQGFDVVEFTADKVGTFNWNCNNFCGSGHSGMKGTLIVTE